MGKIKLFFLIINTAVILTMIFAGVSCTTPVEDGETVPPGQLAYVTWVLQSYGNPDNLTPAVPDAQVTLIFRSIQMSFDGFGGVNNYGGNYKVDGDKLTIENIISTQLLAGAAYGTGNNIFQNPAFCAGLSTNRGNAYDNRNGRNSGIHQREIDRENPARFICRRRVTLSSGFFIGVLLTFSG